MSESEYRTLVQSRAFVKGNITRILNYFENNPEVSIDDVENRNAKLQEWYTSFGHVQCKIDQIIQGMPNNESLANVQEQEKDQFDNNYYKAANFISQRRRELKLRENVLQGDINNTQSGSNRVIVKESNSILPRIEIRPFDGNPLEWHSFRDTFLSIVHENSSLPAVQKFHILKNSLHGNLITIMDSLTASEENYGVAWELLKLRCDRPRQIIYSHIKALLELPENTKDSPANMRNFREKSLMHYKALESLKEPVESWNSILVYVLSQKLDKHTRRTWERSLEPTDRPTFIEFIQFLTKQERGDETESLERSSRHNNQRFNHKGTHDYNRRGQSFVSTQRALECLFCKSDHLIFQCEGFLKLSAQDRCNAAKERRLCINCLKQNHSTSKCLSSGCKKCNKRHNTLLHFVNYKPTEVEKGGSSNSDKIEIPKNTCTAIYGSEVLMGTARVKIMDNFNQAHECRVLLDGGSQSHFITEELAEKLQLRKNKINLPFAGLGQLTTRANFSVRTKIMSKVNSFHTELEFVALPVITNILPSKYINAASIMIPHNITLADPEFNKPAKIDALLGSTVFYKLLCNGQIKLVNNADIVLQKTLVGWIVTGEVSMPLRNASVKSCNLITSINDKLERFWQIEEIPTKKLLSREETLCEEIYANTTKRDKDGRYTVRLPFNELKNNIGNSYDMALKRFYSLERKLKRDETLKRDYESVINEYCELGHMEEITHINSKNQGYYIPHHAVIKQNSESTKLRVVFDASAKGSRNISLNNSLLVGPTIQDELLFILLRFRLRNIAITADIQKMYRQIKIDASDAPYQKILWRSNENDTLKIFQLTTVTQGTASAPFLATRTLHQLSIDEALNYPLASEVLRSSVYVDDLLVGVNTIEEALLLKNQLINILQSGGFQLHKWASNRTEISNESTDFNDLKDIHLDSKDKRILGVIWDSNQDKIKYRIEPLTANNRHTKRTILSRIAQLFDPLGILGPVIVVSKLIMQELWKNKLEWDESLPLSLQNRWLTFNSDLHALNLLQIPRQVTLKKNIDYQVHGFCDASEHAYGACIYLRSVDHLNNCVVNLICSKSRIAPLKVISLPRLELCAALLLSKLINTVIDALKLNISKIRLWSDSTITLNWIKMSPHTLQTFVANRVTEIQAITNVENWFHIAGSENPADYISRGQNASLFINNKHWFNGPEWLTQSESEWKYLQLSNVVVPEQRVKSSLVAQAVGTICGVLKRLIGGRNLERGTFNNVVRVFGQRGKRAHISHNGVIFNERWIAVTADCVSAIRELRLTNVKVVAGQWNRTASEDSVQKLDVVLTRQYSDVDNSPFGKSINLGLLKLNGSLRFGEFISAIPFSRNLTYPSGHAIIIGWGSVRVADLIRRRLPKVIQILDVDIIPQDRCMNAITLMLHHGWFKSAENYNMFNLCTGRFRPSFITELDPWNVRGPTHGDDGVPLMQANQQGEYKVIGINSAGAAQVDLSVDTHTAPFVRWIESEIAAFSDL